MGVEELGLPKLKDIDPKSEDYLEQLEAGFKRILEIREDHNKQNIRDAFTNIGAMFSDVPELLKEDSSEREDYFAGKTEEVEERIRQQDEIDNAGRGFLEAILMDFTEMHPIVEEGNRVIKLYVTQGEPWLDVTPQKEPSVSEFDVNLELQAYNGGEESRFKYDDFGNKRKLKKIIKKNKGKDVYFVHNPSKAIKLDTLANYAGKVLWERFREKQPEAAAKIEKELKEKEKPRISEIIVVTGPGMLMIERRSIPQTTISEKTYREKCPDCPASFLCPLYMAAKERYEK